MIFIRLIAAAVAMALTSPAHAQPLAGSNVDAFVKAIEARDSNKALELIRSGGATIFNGRSYAGQTALIAAIEGRNDAWIRFLLKEGSDPNVANKDSDTPLIAAARIGHLGAVEALLASDADVNLANSSGETPLIIAVNQRQPQIVRQLLAKGADPDTTDSVAGYSARDYARRDSRSPQILRMIEAADAKSAAAQ